MYLQKHLRKYLGSVIRNSYVVTFPYVHNSLCTGKVVIMFTPYRAHYETHCLLVFFILSLFLCATFPEDDSYSYELF